MTTTEPPATWAGLREIYRLHSIGNARVWRWAAYGTVRSRLERGKPPVFCLDDIRRMAGRRERRDG